jgi:hypothetical protein
MSPVAGVDVEFHIISFAQLRRSRPSMFFYDLIAGHHRLRGGDQPFGNCDQHRHARNLPLAEATRLLMNRGTGLLLSREKLNHTVLRAEDADFVARNVAKAELALGDAVLTALGQYHWSCLERRRRLPVLSLPGGMPWFDELCHHHAVGVEFKLHPQKSVAPVEVLRRDLEEVADLMLRVWLWLEATRLGQRFSSAREYVAATVNKCPETSPWRNRLLNAWIFGPGSFVSRKSHRHPRERILNALAILLWDRDDPGNYLARALRGPFNRPATRAELLEGYRRIWEHVR